MCDMWFLRLCTVCAWLNHYAQSLPLCNLYWGRRCSFCLLHPRTMGMFFVVIIIYSNIRCKVMQSKVKISSTQQEKQIAKPIAVWSIHNSFVLKLLFMFFSKALKTINGASVIGALAKLIKLNLMRLNNISSYYLRILRFYTGNQGLKYERWL